jgi:hypothetical protein
MSPRIGDHLTSGEQHGIYVTGNFVITHRNGSLEKESFDSPAWRNSEVKTIAFCNYHIVAEELYKKYRGKYYSTIGGFINDVTEITHGKNGAYKLLGVLTAGVGTSVFSAGVESCEGLSKFVSEGDNFVTQTLRATIGAPVALGYTIIKSPIFLMSKYFNFPW